MEQAEADRGIDTSCRRPIVMMPGVRLIVSTRYTGFRREQRRRRPRESQVQSTLSGCRPNDADAETGGVVLSKR